MVIRTGGEVFGIGNPVAGVGGGILISRVKNLVIPSGARMADLQHHTRLSTFAFSDRLLQANFLPLCPVIIFAKLSHTQINKEFVIGVVISYVESRAMALGGI